MDNKMLYQLHADFCKFMGNPKRIEILFILGDQEMCVDEIVKRMNIRISNVSQHLAVMREKGVVEVRREGIKMYYKLSNPKTLEACIIMKDIMIEQMKKALNIIENKNK